MVALPQALVASSLPEPGQGDQPLIPDAKYQAIIVKSDIVDNKKGTGKNMVLTFVITSGQYKDTEFTEWLSFINPNAVAERIAGEKIRSILDAAGVATFTDTNQVHSKPLIIEVVTEAGEPWKNKDGIERKGSDKSVIKKIHSLPKTGSGVPPTDQSVAQQSSAPATAAAPPWAQQAVA